MFFDKVGVVLFSIVLVGLIRWEIYIRYLFLGYELRVEMWLCLWDGVCVELVIIRGDVYD